MHKMEAVVLYNSSEISDRIKQVAKSRGIPIRRLLEAVNLGPSTMNNMKNSVPKADNLAKIADYLGCSVDYLLGREPADSGAGEGEQKNALPAASGKEDALNKELISRLVQLTPAELEKVDAFVQGLLASR